MKSNEPQTYGVELRRLLISSSSSSASSRRANHADDAMVKAAARAASNTSSMSVDSSSSSATSGRNFSHRSTSLPIRQQHTTEKVVPASPSPETLAAGRHRACSGSSDSAESHDYVDALASSAFHDCRSAAKALFSTQQLLSFTDANSTVLKDADDSPRTCEGAPGASHSEEMAPHADDVGANMLLESSSAAEIKNKSAIFNDDEVNAAGRGCSPSTVAGEEAMMVCRTAMAQHGNAMAHTDERLSVTMVAASKSGTPASMHLIPPPPHVVPLYDEGLSTDTASSSRHQVGVWKAIYGKEKWTGPRLSFSHAAADSEDMMSSSTEDRDGSPAAAAAAPTTPRSEVDQASAFTCRRAHSSEWTATRKTALETLRLQLITSLGDDAGSRGEQHLQRQPSLPPAKAAHQDIQAEEPTIIDAVVQEREVEEEEEEEVPFEVFEVMSAQSAPPQVVADVAPTESGAASVTRSSAENAVPYKDSPHEHRRTAEDVLAHIFSGALPEAPADDHKAASNDNSNSEVRSSVKSTSFAAPSSRLVIRPTLSAEVSGLSPIKREDPSILVDLYDTPEYRATRPVRTPVKVAVMRAADKTTAGKIPQSAILSEGRQPQQRQRVLSEGQGEYTMDMSSMDFRTAQTAPTSSASSVTCVSPVRRSDLYSAALAQLQDEQHRRSYRRGDHGAADTLDPSQLNPASSLRTDDAVSVFPATVPNVWDAARVQRWRSKELQTQVQMQNTTALASSSSHHRNTSNSGTAAAMRQERVRQELRAKELAECSFHPTLSPGTRAMVRVAQQREIEKSLLDTTTPPPPSRLSVAANSSSAGGGAKRASSGTFPQAPTPAPDPRTIRATLQNVYKRLYPVELSAATSRKQILDQEMEYRRLAREELILLRRRAGVVRHASGSRGFTRRGESFVTFMSNILQTEWGEQVATDGRRTSVGAFPSSSVHAQPAHETTPIISTPYMSPMAVALFEEKKVKRKYNTRREAEMQQSQLNDTRRSQATAATGEAGARFNVSTAAQTSTPEGAGAEEEFRIALFDEFLLRQNAHYFNRARTVRDLERELTPAFTPTTTHKSARLVKEMVSRSLVNESMGPDTSSVVAQCQRQHIPIASSFVTQHQSPYKDPCTFKPQLSPAARAHKAAERQRQRSANERTPASPSAHQKEFFDRLYKDHARMEHVRAKAKEAAAKEEMAGVTFKPQLNASTHSQVKSVLDPQNYKQYQQYLQAKQQRLEAQRQALLVESEEAEEGACTFRPQTTKTPAYISKMAKGFGVLRQQDVEF
ncbi:hypothetical protein ABL78_0027 [Leptomonas seymouri]|uniref:Uncharacterized protein n=1 Tax=Leptomonas seymouri TaxID=5684 RepID=A0A0N1I2H7_LEPSE|nr:hypothetical protein ABL78_0027 [Leptomonas seymouri]|eukprot:KPI90794.1 hypothetical protein ABL78_0027 [Leptomonas seymouri]